MAKPKEEKIIITEHVLEVRHAASGTFLDVRGYIADYIKQEGPFPHWKIGSNVVNFRDESKALKLDGAFVGYKSAGYIVLNPKTRNYFTDRASSFWKVLLKNNHYTVPQPTRFGARTKLFFPSVESFETINTRMYETFFSEAVRNLVGGKETDLQFTVDLKEENFEVRVIGGPIQKDEAGKYFQFETEAFSNSGLYLDIDYFKTKDLSLQDIPKLLKKANELTWSKAERIASGLGL